MKKHGEVGGWGFGVGFWVGIFPKTDEVSLDAGLVLGSISNFVTDFSWCSEGLGWDFASEGEREGGREGGRERAHARARTSTNKRTRTPTHIHTHTTQPAEVLLEFRVRVRREGNPIGFFLSHNPRRPFKEVERVLDDSTAHAAGIKVVAHTGAHVLTQTYKYNIQICMRMRTRTHTNFSHQWYPHRGLKRSLT